MLFIVDWAKLSLKLAVPTNAFLHGAVPKASIVEAKLTKVTIFNSNSNTVEQIFRNLQECNASEEESPPLGCRPGGFSI
jgi:hypothetical protein